MSIPRTVTRWGVAVVVAAGVGAGLASLATPTTSTSTNPATSLVPQCVHDDYNDPAAHQPVCFTVTADNEVLWLYPDTPTAQGRIVDTHTKNTTH